MVHCAAAASSTTAIDPSPEPPSPAQSPARPHPRRCMGAGKAGVLKFLQQQHDLGAVVLRGASAGALIAVLTACEVGGKARGKRHAAPVDLHTAQQMHGI